MNLQTALLVNNIEPSLKPPITPSSRTRKGRKKRVITIDSTTNKIQRGLKNTASVLYRRSILTPISENISGLVLKNHSKEMRNDGWDRHKQSLIPKAIHSEIWEV